MKGRTWFINLLHEVTPAVPIKTISLGCKLNFPANKYPVGDEISALKILGFPSKSSVLRTYTSFPLDVDWFNPFASAKLEIMECLFLKDSKM